MQAYYIAVSDSFSKTWKKNPPSQPLFNFRQVHLLKSVRKEKPRRTVFFSHFEICLGLNLTTWSQIHQLRKPHAVLAPRVSKFVDIF